MVGRLRQEQSPLIKESRGIGSSQGCMICHLAVRQVMLLIRAAMRPSAYSYFGHAHGIQYARPLILHDT